MICTVLMVVALRFTLVVNIIAVSTICQPLTYALYFVAVVVVVDATFILQLLLQLILQPHDVAIVVVGVCVVTFDVL